MPTREERERWASLVDSAAYQAEQSGFPGVAVRLNDAATELRKDCGGCKWFIGFNFKTPWASCAAQGGMHAVPKDGSGFCFRHEPKAPVNAEAVK